jgi:hypothetical protein
MDGLANLAFEAKAMLGFSVFVILLALVGPYVEKLGDYLDRCEADRRDRNEAEASVRGRDI